MQGMELWIGSGRKRLVWENGVKMVQFDSLCGMCYNKGANVTIMSQLDCAHVGMAQLDKLEFDGGNYVKRL